MAENQSATPAATGVRIAFDVGTVRIGVAASDPAGTMAFPVATISRGERAVRDAVAAVEERNAAAVYVGLPRSLSGHEGPSAADARAFASALAELVRIPVRLVDERFSTSSAHVAMAEAGRDSRQRRQLVDQQAAVVILETALNTEKHGQIDTVAESITPRGSHD